MALLVLGLLLFLGVHSLRIVAPGPREALIARFGEGGYKGLYGVIAAVGLVLIAWGYGAAREAPVILYDPPTATRHIALLLMLPVFPLLFAAYLPGRIKTAAKHPMLLAVKIWALAHLLANGTLADFVLFAGFLAWAVIDRISVKRRPRGPAVGAPAGRFNDAIAVGGGLLLYVAFVGGLHAALFGVSPLA